MKNTLFNRAFGGIDSKNTINIPSSKGLWLTKEELKKLYPPKRTMFQNVVVFIKKLFKK